jgi:hypothetical protein
MPVYEYQKIDLYHATSDDVYMADIRFEVGKAWLDDQKMTYRDVQLLRYHANVWEKLDTEYLGMKDGNYQYRATCGGFSYFATALVKDAAIMPASPPAAQSGMPAGTGASVPSPSPSASERKAPTMPTPRVTPFPAPENSLPEFPVAAMALIGAGCVVLIGSGWYIRRWWIRRQNPALFRDYD